MRCHYEVLDLPLNADDAQIKTAYRKQALRWHPDKNKGDEENAKTEFQLVQQAYEVLSDRQERAWYDNHREQILRGGNKDFEDNCLDVYQYFTTSCFKGYGDDDDGFYAVYRTVFENIAKEDIEFMDDKEEFCKIPMFGSATSGYDETVGPFYAFWSGYNTKKTFVWLDPFKIQDTRLKKLYKLMEKDNKKIRAKAKQERNEEVRALVAFVRKRDKRVKEHAKVEEARILENRQKQEELSQARRIQRRKELSEAKSCADWAKFDNVRDQLQQIEKDLAKEFGEKLSDEEFDSDSELLDNVYCHACNKIFKTHKAFQNHETSKKHKENIEVLREYMIEEEKIVNGEENKESESKISENFNEDSLENEDILEELSGEEIEVKSKKHKRKSKKVIQALVTDLEELDLKPPMVETSSNSTEVPEDLVLTKKQKRRSKKARKSPCTESVVVADEEVAVEAASNSTEAPEDFVLTKKQKRRNKKADENACNENAVAADEETPKEKTKPNKKVKKGVKATNDITINNIDLVHCCVICKANFPSKNKLFDHLKKEGHGVYLPQNQKTIKINKKKGKASVVEV